MRAHVDKQQLRVVCCGYVHTHQPAVFTGRLCTAMVLAIPWHGAVEARMRTMVPCGGQGARSNGQGVLQGLQRLLIQDLWTCRPTATLAA